MIRNWALAGSAVLLALAGCGSTGGRADAAAGVAVRLLTAVTDRDASAACELLAPRTREQVAADGSCEDAILDENLPEPGPVERSEVYGQRAQVRLAGDTVFLAAFPGGWRVVAAGCTPRGEQPYDCSVQGG